MTGISAILAALAVYRVARMIAEEDGPLFVFKKLRGRFTNDKSSLAVGLRCYYCLSFWVALPATVLLCLAGDWPVALWPIWWLGLSGAAAKIFEFWNVKR